jgi:hypothetical protein
MPESTGTISVVDIDVAEERLRPRLLALLFCDFASFTKDEKVNLLGVFDRVFVDPEERQSPTFIMYVRVAEALEGLTHTIFGPTNQPVLQAVIGPPAQVKERVCNRPQQVQALIALQFKAEIEGVFWFDISYRGKSLGGAGLVVEYRKTEDKQGGTDTYV